MNFRRQKTRNLICTKLHRKPQNLHQIDAFSSREVKREFENPDQNMEVGKDCVELK